MLWFYFLGIIERKETTSEISTDLYECALYAKAHTLENLNHAHEPYNKIKHTQMLF